ncbi:MAG: hypothetical protein JSV55_07660 [Deltaproteobacteria bacterium]|nr:MAG: hypothetical protein JSV55_07660 [Deltaproteobacteria bacterium]
MIPVIPIHSVSQKDRSRVGGKGFALAMMARNRMNVPDAACIGQEAYREYVTATGLRERILLELHRKDFGEMRCEELWDAALRIRNMFLNTPIPPALLAALKHPIEAAFQKRAVVVRSSAPGEDSAKASFAGVHESYVNIRGPEAILEHVRLVWASLWSDAALLYRRELGLDVEKSTMAVVVQEIIAGQQSGVAFGRNPNDDSQAVIEAVYGLNQGLVDGTVEPDRWILNRKTGEVVSHTPAHRQKAMVPSVEGVKLKSLPPAKSGAPPLDEKKIKEVFDLALRAERLFGLPQDVEWTFTEDMLYALQSRPITTKFQDDSGDKRPWYRSLRRSFENLQTLRTKIEKELIPAMIEEAKDLASQDLTKLSDIELADEITRRSGIYEKWVDMYWREFIPFAHGARLFGQVYNDVMRPSDPFEFMNLLAATQMKSLERNRMLEKMASMIRANPALAEGLTNPQVELDEGFRNTLNEFVAKFGDLFRGVAQSRQQQEAISKLLLEMASRSPQEEHGRPKEITALKKGFLSRFKGEQRAQAIEMLELGRASYRLRDDDNIHLGRIEGQMLATVNEGRRRVRHRYPDEADHLGKDAVIAALQDPHYIPQKHASAERVREGYRVKVRQLVGQPAGPGIAKGKARVIMNPSDLLDFKAHEILVCDAVDPNMTFVVPLSAGIVERRGGMLIHGAIIAREYGLPCVTGVPDATSLIRTGDQLSVDGYLGIVILG